MFYQKRSTQKKKEHLKKNILKRLAIFNEKNNCTFPHSATPHPPANQPTMTEEKTPIESALVHFPVDYYLDMEVWVPLDKDDENDQRVLKLLHAMMDLAKKIEAKTPLTPTEERTAQVWRKIAPLLLVDVEEQSDLKHVKIPNDNLECVLEVFEFFNPDYSNNRDEQIQPKQWKSHKDGGSKLALFHIMTDEAPSTYTKMDKYLLTEEQQKYPLIEFPPRKAFVTSDKRAHEEEEEKEETKKARVDEEEHEEEEEEEKTSDEDYDPEEDENEEEEDEE